MSVEMYHVICTSEDGISVKSMSKDEVEKRLKEEYWGKKEMLSKLPNDSDPNYWGSSLVIIKGSIVVPQPVKVVEEYKIP